MTEGRERGEICGVCANYRRVFSNMWIDLHLKEWVSLKYGQRLLTNDDAWLYMMSNTTNNKTSYRTRVYVYVWGERRLIASQASEKKGNRSDRKSRGKEANEIQGFDLLFIYKSILFFFIIEKKASNEA